MRQNVDGESMMREAEGVDQFCWILVEMTFLSLLGHGMKQALLPLLLLVLVAPSHSFQPLLQPSSLLRKPLVSSAKAPRTSIRLASSLRAGYDFSKEHNHRLVDHFHHLRKQEYFRLFAVDLLSSCTYMPTADMPCEMDRCEIESAEDVREDLRVRDAREHSFRLDGWVRWDMPGDFTEYYDIYEEGERYTGYDGKRVWDFIHDRICFQVEVDDPENAWKRDFNRAVSGLHTSVSSHVLLSMKESEGLTEEQEMAEYQRRIAQVPEAVGNLYFAYMIMLCAIQNASNRLNNCSYMGAWRR
ncbi:hypothetical protein GUITHDRAFT_115427 [Guillardia theta CCMP2712]|uniref:Uncharacterized protein n=1 Tax=Guillardia theta (strain CCMP2712) TaxID=905079 RepID=L1IQA0_GUITC|nr:hypothetical protein GUITHDRAFT_115427 [Guillardia theta CCMP2712]EKX38461.1 hypothetical protein GUITHDRAFT_115427 [Guillardia theta CCMP2712]|eukprot:XP_005825441.1 hypothetical protein GUITHDRAFT_115427 [Guillardia theta CCMP2712]